MIIPTQYRKPKNIRALGATSADGIPYVCVKACKRAVWVPLADFADNGKAARTKLNAANIVLLNHDWKRCRDVVEALADFQPKPILLRSGWSGCHFALPDGRVFSPTDGEAPVVLFDLHPFKCLRKGSAATWYEGSDILEDQFLLTFLVMTAFAAPLLSLTDRIGNIGFELAGLKGLGKSTAQQMVASATGGGVEQPGRNYWISGNTTPNGLETEFPVHNDLPMIIEELNLYAAGESDRTRATKIDELIFRLSDGTIKARHQAARQQPSRFIYVASTNVPLAQVLLGYRKEVSDAAADRLLTLPLNDREYGIFDSLPDGFVSGRQFAEHLTALAAKHHGVAMPRFLRRLVADRAQNEAKLKKRIQRYMIEFRKRVGVDENNGSATRVADAFGLVFAAGMLAKSYKALGGNLKCGKSALLAYELNRSASSDAPSMVERLVKLAKSPDTLHIDPDNLPDLDNEAFKALPAVLKRNAKGETELLLSAQAVDRAFPIRGLLFDDTGVAALLVRDKDRRKTVKRSLRAKHKAERVYCFRLPVGSI